MSSLKDIQNSYPIFEANQVLSNRHLNAVFDYLDKQERLTRTHLIGIGIVCGWEVRFESSKNPLEISISKGCGVTSEGYLLKTEDAKCLTFRDFAATEPLYEPLKGLDIKELSTNTADQPITLEVLKNKVLVLFVELKNEGLRNCSPNNCDDKGREVTATVRALLVPKPFANASIQAPLKFEDLRVRRIDVPRTSLTTAQDVLEAYADAVHETEGVLKAIEDLPFSLIWGNEKIKTNRSNTDVFNNTDATFLQNYYDFLDDLTQAYNELRARASELFCTCCPDGSLFPQHLILGSFDTTGTHFGTESRTDFMPSSATTHCEEEIDIAKKLFNRIKVMVEKFDIQPNTGLSRFETLSFRPINKADIRITPTQLGTKLSKKAIPYYYNNPHPALLPLWNPKKTRKNKQKQNLGYFASAYATDDFVKEPLKYDLESYNFLRIEGHLGQNYEEALTQLLDLKKQYRLPIDVIAVRAGSFDENTNIDFTKEKCHFEDLEAVYDAFRDELRCSLGKAIINLGNIKFTPTTAAPIAIAPDTKPNRIPLFNDIVEDFKPIKGTLGEFMAGADFFIPSTTPEPAFLGINKLKLPTLDLGRMVASPIFNDAAVRTSLNSISQLTTIINLLTEDLADLDWERFEKEHDALKKLKPDTDADSTKEVRDQLTAVITACRLEGLRSIIEEFRRRLKEVKQQQYLSFFLQKHPGIQHKAGVPLGGTFILVYHQDPEPDPKTNFGRGGFVAVAPTVNFKDFLREQRSVSPNIQPKLLIGDKAITIKDDFLADFQKSILNLNDSTLSPINPRNTRKKEDEKIIAEALQRLPDGVVIADFFLPYLCTSNCAPVQFVLPKSKPTFSYKIETCPDPQNQGMATVSFKPQGGTPDYEVSIDGGINFEPLKEQSLSGTHTIMIRDAEGIVSAPKTIIIPDPISADLSEFKWDDKATKNTYTQTVSIKGGIAPFTVKFNDKIATTSDKIDITDLKNGERYQISITDSNGCTFTQKDFIRACQEPCGGLKTQKHYMLPVRVQQNTNKIAIKIISFQLENDVLVKDKAQDFAPLIKVQDFLKSTLNVKRNLWQIVGFKTFTDSENKPQLLGMQIEQPLCQNFKLAIELIENKSQYQLIYTQHGLVEAIEKNPEGQVVNEFKVPTFEISEADLCSADPTFKAIEREEFKVFYNRETRSAESSPDGIVKIWYWEKQSGEKSNKREQTFDTVLTHVSRTAHLLVGFTKEGSIKIEKIIV